MELNASKTLLLLKKKKKPSRCTSAVTSTRPSKCASNGHFHSGKNELRMAWSSTKVRRSCLRVFKNHHEQERESREIIPYFLIINLIRVCNIYEEATIGWGFHKVALLQEIRFALIQTIQWAFSLCIKLLLLYPALLQPVTRSSSSLATDWCLS